MKSLSIDCIERSVETRTKHKLIIEFIDPITLRRIRVRKSLVVKQETNFKLCDDISDLTHKLETALFEGITKFQGPYWRWENVNSLTGKSLSYFETEAKNQELRQLKSRLNAIIDTVIDGVVKEIGCTRHQLGLLNHEMHQTFPLIWKDLPPIRNAIAVVKVEEIGNGDL